MEEINRLKAQLFRTFDMKDLGSAKHILGMEIHRDKKNCKLWLSQQKYVEKVLQKFYMNNVKPVNVPLASHFKLSSVLSPRTDEEKQYMPHVIWTKENHLQVVFTLASGAISWMSKLQETVVLSTTEAEYIAALDASKEAIWLKGLLDEIGKTQEKVNILCDSQSAIHLATNPAYRSRTKHIDVRYHFLRHVIDGGKVALQKVPTQENCANIFTKPVTVEKLRWCLASLGLQKR
eukprot:PITA_36708